jgi:membrane protease YdiL (CAAX protease family)
MEGIMKKIINGLLMVIGYFVIYIALGDLLRDLLGDFYRGLTDNMATNNLLYSLTFALLTAMYLIAFSTKELKKDFIQFFKRTELNLFKILIYLGAMYAVTIVVNLILVYFDLLNQSENQEVINALFTEAPSLTFFFGAVVAPLIEELTFRLGFRKMIKNDLLFILVSTFCFAFIHVLSGDYINIIPYLVLGAVLGIAYVREKSIFFVIMLHSVWNAIAFLIQSMADKL